MHPNGVVLKRLYSSLDQHMPSEMARCYDANAKFRDIAFDLEGRDAIHKMWRMICSGDIRTTFEVVRADDESGVVKLWDTQTGAQALTLRAHRSAAFSVAFSPDSRFLATATDNEVRLWDSGPPTDPDSEQ